MLQQQQSWAALTLVVLIQHWLKHAVKQWQSPPWLTWTKLWRSFPPLCDPATVVGHFCSWNKSLQSGHITSQLPSGLIVPPFNQASPICPSDSRSLLSLPPCSEWKGIHSAMNVNQSEDERGPNAAVLLWSTQAERHLTENFLIAPWSCSINGLALAIICPRFPSFERETIVRHTSKPRPSSPLLWVIWGVWMV